MSEKHTIGKIHFAGLPDHHQPYGGKDLVAEQYRALGKVNIPKGVELGDVGFRGTHTTTLTNTPDTSAIELVRELLDFAETTRTRISNWQYRDDLISKAEKWLEGK